MLKNSVHEDAGNQIYAVWQCDHVHHFYTRSTWEGGHYKAELVDPKEMQFTGHLLWRTVLPSRLEYRILISFLNRYLFSHVPIQAHLLIFEKVCLRRTLKYLVFRVFDVKTETFIFQSSVCKRSNQKSLVGDWKAKQSGAFLGFNFHKGLTRRIIDYLFESEYYTYGLTTKIFMTLLGYSIKSTITLMISAFQF